MEGLGRSMSEAGRLIGSSFRAGGHSKGKLLLV
jgi:hypothetical protein